MAFNIIVIEDDKFQREELEEALADIGHKVKAFRDLLSFKGACLEANKEGKDLFGDPVGSAQGAQTSRKQSVAIFDVMLARQLKEDAFCAERWTEAGFPPEDEPQYVDDELGLRIAQSVRKGEYAEAVPRNTPILFLTARQNDRLMDEMRRLEPSIVVGKPAFIERIEESLVELVTKGQSVM
jgi:CheY-like chemotaxis protein